MSKITDMVRAWTAGGGQSENERLLSLEGGDAWTGSASGRVLTSGNPPTWEEAAGGGGGGSANVGDRARLIDDGPYDPDTGSFPVAFADPQPDGASVPTGWTIANGGLLLPAGMYWVRALWGGYAAEAGQFRAGAAFFEDYWNGSGAWGVDDLASVAVTVAEGESFVLEAKGIVYTAAPDELHVPASTAAMQSATGVTVSLLVTRIA